jgi:alpha-glucuronidase
MRSRLCPIVCAVASALVFLDARAAGAESGHDLWLRYQPLPEAVRAQYSRAISTIVVPLRSATGDAIAAELTRGLKGLLGRDIPRVERADAAGTVIVATPSSAPAVAALGWDAELRAAGEEGYIIRAAQMSGRPAIVITSIGESGALYGTFRFLRLLQTHEPIASLDIVDRPRLGRRLLNHWDNLDGSVERGYAGRSLFWPAPSESRIVDYARANASIGINGAVINNVNANPQVLTAPWLDKVSAIARLLRPYRIRVYLSANFAAPVMIGGLATNDPRDAAVVRWWREKADEIYRRIPDFGGFVVKANSEGQPGPQDYHRTHADGANLLADALAPHGGIVMWRAFVYDASVDRDRVKRAYAEFVPLDGAFRGNVFAQVKNGPLDFQPREPFHPLFGAMPKTPLMAEVQITQEYLGQSTHAVYLAPMWTEFLNADTYARGPGSFVSRVVDGSLEGKRETGMAGVANTGLDGNWTGHDLAQANWYAFGRLAWNPSLDAAAIADEWIRMTWSAEPTVVATIRSILLDSREAYVHYTMPLGLHHLIGGDHYAPMPGNTDPRRDDWSATTYHRADADAIGVDRTKRGSGAVDQYQPPLREQWSDPASTPDELLLWFHRLPWTYRMKSGRTLWDELVHTYTRGAEEARGLEARWIGLAGKIDDERYRAVLARLGRQAADAAAWRDKCLGYFDAARAGQGPRFVVAHEGSRWYTRPVSGGHR